MNKAKIVIVGAGYGGMNTAVTLSKKMGHNEAQLHWSISMITTIKQPGCTNQQQERWIQIALV
ncbi:NADH dehydrogenase [Bacillus sp. JCM 19046]|nr:NADH dehydrogenase [Bacillus sp. JCM 19046]